MSEFDKYRNSYDDEVQRALAFSGMDVRFFAELKTRHLLRVSEKHLENLGLRAALDVGCGLGGADRYLKGEFAELCGLDTSSALLDEAKRNNPEVSYLHYEGENFPYPNDRFDVTFAMGVFHHIPEFERDAFIQEMHRVTRPGGIVVIFEHNPLNPLTRKVVKQCRLDEGVTLIPLREIKKLFTAKGFSVPEHRYIGFFPFEGRLLFWLERLLGRIPIGAQYYVTAVKRLQVGG